MADGDRRRQALPSLARAGSEPIIDPVLVKPQHAAAAGGLIIRQVRLGVGWLTLVEGMDLVILDEAQA